jgi:hypothetical protein
MLFFRALLRILHDVILRLLTNTRQFRGQIDRTLVYLISDYLYLLMYIIENGKDLKIFNFVFFFKYEYI